MQRDIVLVPVYDRPEFLWLCLEAISHNPEAGDLDIWVLVDQHTNQRNIPDHLEIDRVLSAFCFLRLQKIVQMPHNAPGNSLNVLEGYKRAYEAGAAHVFLVEDDVLITEDFFRWHYAVQVAGDWIASIGFRNLRNSAVGKSTEPGEFFSSAWDYASIGVCFRREKLAAVIPHACAAYYSDSGGYILRTFPSNRFGDCFTEQDGLIMRVMGETNGVTAWPYVPRAYHLGWYGYHRSGAHYAGRLEERVQRLRYAISDPATLARMNRDAWGDIEQPPALTPVWERLIMKQEL